MSLHTTFHFEFVKPMHAKVCEFTTKFYYPFHSNINLKWLLSKRICQNLANGECLQSMADNFMAGWETRI